MVGSRLGSIADAIGGRVEPAEARELVVTDATHDSRQAGPGVLFVAVVGEKTDGHDHAAAAVAAGSPAVCVSRSVNVGVPEVVVDDTRAAMGPLASIVHGEPSRSVGVIGVTGTNGKTTVTHFVESIANSSGRTAGLVGTVGARSGGQPIPLERTTPEATDLQRLFARMRDDGCDLVAMEVSSHALSLGRVRGTRFEVAAFTNLSRDHLDFHGDMGSYRAAKETLFHDYEVGTAVINVDDPTGGSIAATVKVPLVEVGQGRDAYAADVRLDRSGTTFDLVTPWGRATVTAPVAGRFNVDNAVIAAVCCLVAGVGFDAVCASMEKLPVVPGRFERVSGDDPVTVIVDYAHTPDGISHAISAAREIGAGRVIALAGAGGDRDRDKRAMMGGALSAADVAVVTSDNPRSEDPRAIVEAVVAGVRPGTELRVEPDRLSAIEVALAEAGAGDVVLVLGRGHEPYQELADGKVEFDDRVVAARALENLRGSAGSGLRTGSMEP
jgi:UDP-N-acetylmuramoyl-L-alanyl-D-glutamate--2,6-diaminopimelate ligase